MPLHHALPIEYTIIYQHQSDVIFTVILSWYNIQKTLQCMYDENFHPNHWYDLSANENPLLAISDHINSN